MELELSGDIERLDVKLSCDIKEVKVDVERVEVKLSGEIKEVRAEIKDVRRDIKESELRLFVRLIFAMGVIGGILKYLPTCHF